MILHLIKDPSDPFVTQVLSSVRSSPPTAVLLHSTDSPPQSLKATIYRVTENLPDKTKGEISYERLVDLIFEADKVMTL